MLKVVKSKIFIAILILVVGFIYLIQQRKMTIPFFYKYDDKEYFNIGFVQTSHPLQIQNRDITHFNPSKLQEIPPVIFMADPFVVKEKEEYFLFFELFSGKTNSTFGDLGVLKSRDKKSWEYLGTILDEPFHLSFPNVYKINNTWYMIPESGASHQLRLYESHNFPFDWKLKSILVDHEVFADPFLIQKDGYYYIFVQNNKDFSFRLYVSQKLESGWIEHPASPIRTGQNNRVRPAGQAMTIHDTLYYFMQDHSNGYGTAVMTFRIDSLSPTQFHDTPVSKNPTLKGYGNGWAKNGMHTLNCIQENKEDYFCVVDGREHKVAFKGWDWKNWPKFRL